MEILSFFYNVYAILEQIFLAGEIDETSKDVVLSRLEELEQLESCNWQATVYSILSNFTWPRFGTCYHHTDCINQLNFFSADITLA